jgi:phosphomannomutase/phosphoglucomutase
MALQLTFLNRSSKSTAHATDTPQTAATLLKFWVFAFLGLTVITAFITAALIWKGVDLERQDRSARLQNTAQAVAQSMSKRNRDLQTQLMTWAYDPRLRNIFEYAEQANIGAEEQQLRRRVPGALAIQLIRLKSSATGTSLVNDDEQRLSYAGIDQARQVISSSNIAPLEAHRVKQEDEHLSIMGPVFAADKQNVIGLVHLLLPLSILPTPVTADIAVVFQQQVGRQAAVLGIKTPKVPENALQQVANVANTNLQVLAWQATRDWSTMPLTGLIFLTAGIWLVSSALIMIGSALWQRFAMHQDGQIVMTELTSLLRGDALTKPSKVRYREFAHLTQAIRQFIKQSPQQGIDTNTTMPHFGSEPSRLVPELTAETQSVVLIKPSDDDHVDVTSETMPTSVLHQTSAMPSSKIVTTATAPIVKAPPSELLGTIPARVFRSYDIRGLVATEITTDFMLLLGQAIGTQSQELGCSAVLVGRDHRPSSPDLSQALVQGLRASGCDVIDVGVVPTPVVYFATHLAGDISGAMITASHNPIEYNGLKLVFAGHSATALQIAKLRQCLQRGEFRSGTGSYREQSVLDDYFDELEQDITITRPLKIVVDCGYATPALVAPQLFRDLGCEVIERGTDLEHPDAHKTAPLTAQERQQALQAVILSHHADLGFAFDGDGDRLNLFDATGEWITTDRIMMLLARDMLTRLPGSDIVFDVKCSRLLATVIQEHGGRPCMWKSGHAFIKEKRQELKAPLAGEFSGHLVFADRWNGFDDAFYAGARILEVLALDARSSTDIFAEFAVGVSTPELKVTVPAGEELTIMSMILETKNRLSGVQVSTVDGLRVDTDKGWGLVRASNTEPEIVFRFEAENDVMLNKLQDLFRRILQTAVPKLTIPF